MNSPTLSKINPQFKMTIEVVALDTLEAVIQFQLQHKKTYAFLVMANPTNPGGGYKEGSPAQEESVCRRTNLVPCLLTQKYPIPEFGGIYVKNLQIIRETEHKQYDFLKTPIISDCVLCAAYSNPTTTKDDHLDSSFRSKTLQKMEAMLNIFLDSGNTRIILGAWGCGAFSNPAQDIAEMFKSLLNSPTYQGRFEHVVFAIIKDQWHQNLVTFKEILEV